MLSSPKPPGRAVSPSMPTGTASPAQTTNPPDCPISSPSSANPRKRTIGNDEARIVPKTASAKRIKTAKSSKRIKPDGAEIKTTRAKRAQSDSLETEVMSSIGENGDKDDKVEEGNDADNGSNTATNDTAADQERIETMNRDNATKTTIKLPYQSIVSVNIPKRSTDGPPQLDDDSTWFKSCDYEGSMIIFWSDIEQVTYTTQATMHCQLFPDVKHIGAEALRKRHCRLVQKLASIYGVKAREDIPDPGQTISRRGKPRKAGNSRRTTPTRSSSSKKSSAKLESKTEARSEPAKPAPAKVPSFVANAPFKVLEKSMAVIWRDHPNFKMSFKDIRNKLEDDFGWSIGLNTVEKNYHTQRPIVYGLATDIKAEMDAAGNRNDKVGAIGKEHETNEDTLVEEDIDQVLEDLKDQTEGGNTPESDL